MFAQSIVEINILSAGIITSALSGFRLYFIILLVISFSNKFTENDIRMAWKKFCDKEKVNGNNNMLSLLNMNDPVIENNSIIISTINKMNQKEVKGYKNKIQAFISKELNNYGITVDVSLDEVKQKKNFVDSKDKLDTLVKENDNISLLINEFKLRI